MKLAQEQHRFRCIANGTGNVVPSQPPNFADSHGYWRLRKSGGNCPEDIVIITPHRCENYFPVSAPPLLACNDSNRTRDKHRAPPRALHRKVPVLRHHVRYNVQTTLPTPRLCHLLHLPIAVIGLATFSMQCYVQSALLV